MQDTPLQPEQILVKTTLYCLHVLFLRAQSILRPYLIIFNSSGGATVCSFRSALFLVLSAANTILWDPAHSHLSTLVSDDISKTHAVVQHLKWVHKL